MKKLFIYLFAALAVASCEHKDLCYDHSHTIDVEVVFDWRNASEAAPESMSLYLFPTNGGEALRYEFTDCGGGTIRVPVGNYGALCLNSDTENVTYRNTDQKTTFEVSTRTTDLLSGLSALGVRSDGVPRADGTETERVALPPDELWSDCTEGIELKQTAPANFTYAGGSENYSVTSYAAVSRPGDATRTVPVAWTAEFVEDDGSGGYNVIARPEWLTAFTASGNGGTSATSFSATIAAQTGVTSNSHNETLKMAASVSGTYDLSTSGGTTAMRTANCYVINAPGQYSLPLVYGNAIKDGGTNASAYTSQSSETSVLKTFVNHLDAAITDPYIYNNAGCTPLDAVLVWQDEENLVTNVRLSSDKHSLTFDVPQATIKQGNAIVAVRDTDSRIMWSWHIWVTDYELGSDVRTVTNYQGIAYKMMPVNIGWCDAETTAYDARSVKVRFTQAETGAMQVITLTQASHSVVNSDNQPYFQFGRKDPMLAGIRNASGSTVDKGCYSDGYAFDKSGTGKVAIGVSIQHPHIFYNYGSLSPYDWCATSYSNLWSADNTVTTANDNAVVKTIYDPSPVGYHLPSSNAFTGFTYNGSNVSGSSYFGSRFNSPYTSTTDFTDNFGWEFYCNKMTGEGSYDTAGGTIFFPASGYRYYSTGAMHSVGSYGYFWSAVPNSTYNGRYLYFSSSSINPLNYSLRSYGFAVRPVQE